MPYPKWRIVERIIEFGFVTLCILDSFFISAVPGWILLTIAGVVLAGLAWRIRHDKLRW